MYKLYDGHGDLDLTTNDLFTFVTGAKKVFIEYVNYCIDNNEDDLDGLAYWSQAFNKVSKIENVDQVKEFASEFDFTVETEEVIVFNTVQKAFCWAFSERENLQRIKSEFKLNDEIESISDVTNVLDSETLENYLIENSYVYKNGRAYEFEY